MNIRTLESLCTQIKESDPERAGRVNPGPESRFHCGDSEPSFDNEQIQALIESQKIVGFTLDTSIFDRFGCNLRVATLAAVKQFKGSYVSVIFSRVTLGELKSHIVRDTTDAASKAKAALNQFFKAWRTIEKKDDAIAMLGIDQATDIRADELINEYTSLIGAKEIETSVSVQELLQRYFAPLPPFSGKKKSEFPDAIALLSLDAWAKKANGYVLVVSEDGDWEAFCATSEWLIFVRDLPTALGFFHKDSRVFAAKIRVLATERKVPDLFEAIGNAVDDFIQDFDVDAGSSYYLDGEPESAVVIDWHIPEEATLDVIESDESSVTVSFSILVDATFGANFSFSIKDGIDKDYLPIGSSYEEAREQFELSITAVIERVDENPSAIAVEIESRRIEISYGDVEPDWGKS